MKQRTILREVSTAGKALHTGEEVKVTFKPAPAGTGIVFRRVDLYGKPEIPATVDLVSEVVRSTTLSTGHAKVHTVEHVLSAFSGMGIDNALVEMDASEPPILDGSAKEFTRMLEEAEAVEQDKEREYYELDAPVSVSNGNRSIIALPYDGLRITCTSADDRGIHCQHLSLDIDADVYRQQVAVSRTFTIYEDIEGLLKMGKIQGGSLDSAIVIKGDKIVTKEPLRFEDEFVRHKILDILGDIALLGRPLKAHLIAALPGHALNADLCRKLRARMKGQPTGSVTKAEPATPVAHPLNEAVLDIRKIINTLPHRYPFLMIDRVVDIPSNEELVAIKNVTINEPYFQGHFPGQPVMPGVLQIEAMAQAAGVLMLRRIGKEGQVCYFLSCDKIKFRNPITPGDQVEIHIKIVRHRANKIAVVQAECKVGGKSCSSGELSFMLMDTGKVDV